MQTTPEEEGRAMEEVMEEERSRSSATAMMRRHLPAAWFFLQRGSSCRVVQQHLMPVSTETGKGSLTPHQVPFAIWAQVGS